MRSKATPARANVPRSSRCDNERIHVEMRHDADGVILEVMNCRSARLIISSTGLRADLRPYRISSCCAAGIIARFTKRAFRSSDSTIARCSSARLTVTRCRMSRRLRRHPTTRRQRFGPGIPRQEYRSTRTRPHQGGTGNLWTSGGQSTCYIPWPPITDTESRLAVARRSSASGARSSAACPPPGPRRRSDRSCSWFSESASASRPA